MAIHIADGYVDAHLRDNTRSDAERMMQRLRSLGPVDIGVKLDSDRLHGELRTLSGQLSLWAQRQSRALSITPHLNAAAFRAELRALGGTIRVPVDLSDNTRDDAELLMQRLRSLGPVDIGVELDDSRVHTQMRVLSAQMTFWARRLSRSLDITPHLDPAVLEAALRSLGGTIRVPITTVNRVREGMAEAYAEILFFKQLAEQQLRVDIRADAQMQYGMLQALDEIEFFRGLAEHRLRIPITTDPQLLALLGRSVGQLGGNLGQLGGQGQQAGQGLKIAAAALLAFPAIATAAAGVVTLGFGAALTALPVLAWKSSERVKDAYRDLWLDLKTGLREITPAWESEVAGWTDILRDTGRQWKPFLTEELEQIRPAVTEFFKDLGKESKHLEPMFDDLTDGLVAMLDKLGPQMGAVFAGLGDGLGALGRSMRDNPEMFGRMLIDLAELVRMTGLLAGAAVELYPVIVQLSGGFDDLNNLLDGTVPGLDGFARAMGDIDGHTSTLDFLSELARHIMMLGMGPLGLVADGIQRIRDLGSGPPAVGWDSFAQTLVAVATGMDGGAAGAMHFADAQLNLVDIMQTAGLTADELKAKLDALTSKFIGERQATRAFEQAIDDMTKSLKQNGKAHDDNSDAGRRNQAALEKIATTAQTSMLKIRENGGSLQRQAAVYDRARKSILSAANAMGIHGKAADKLADDLLGVRSAVLKIPTKRDIKVTANTAPAIEAARRVAAAINAMTASITVTGGTAGGRGPWPNADGNIWSFAGGGEHHIAQIARAGDWRLWAEPETGGEAYIPLAPGKRDRSEAILLEVARRFGLGVMRPMATGGVIGSATPGSVAGNAKPSKEYVAAEKLAKAMNKAADALVSASKGLKGLDKINTFADKLNDTIRKYFSGSKEAALLKYATGIENKMRKAAEESAKIAGVLDEALRFADSTKQSLIGKSDLGSLGPLGSAQDIKSGMQFRAGEMQRFADQIGQLAKLGLNKNLLVEIIGYGPGQGGVIADMLLKDTATLAAINSAQGAIDAAAGNIGNLAADALYDTGARAADGFLTGLKARQAELDASAAQMGAALAAEIARQLDALAKKTRNDAKPGGKNKVGDLKTDLPNKPKKKIGSFSPSIPRRAAGGWLDDGDLAIVGEEGPELIRMGSAPGYVHTARQTQDMLGGNITVNLGGIHLSGTLDFADPAAAERIADQIAEAVQEKIRQIERSKR